MSHRIAQARLHRVIAIRCRWKVAVAAVVAVRAHIFFPGTGK